MIDGDDERETVAVGDQRVLFGVRDDADDVQIDFNVRFGFGHIKHDNEWSQIQLVISRDAAGALLRALAVYLTEKKP